MYLMKFARITVKPEQMGGQPCLRGLRIPVATVADMVTDGITDEEIMEAYPDLESADMQKSLQFYFPALPDTPPNSL